MDSDSSDYQQLEQHEYYKTFLNHFNKHTQFEQNNKWFIASCNSIIESVVVTHNHVPHTQAMIQQDNNDNADYRWWINWFTATAKYKNQYKVNALQ